MKTPIILTVNGKTITLKAELLDDFKSVNAMNLHSELKDLLNEEGKGFIEEFEKITGINLTKGRK